MKSAIEALEESVELILNYKKDGEPFWNLLYLGKSILSQSFSTFVAL